MSYKIRKSDKVTQFLINKAKSTCIPGTPVPSYENQNRDIINSIPDYKKESISGIINLLQLAFNSI